jgi:cobalt-zinc-cadmium efflux system outer membrane protein
MEPDVRSTSRPVVALLGCLIVGIAGCATPWLGGAPREATDSEDVVLASAEEVVDAPGDTPFIEEIAEIAAGEELPPGFIVENVSPDLADSSEVRLMSVDEVLSYTLQNHPQLAALKHEIAAAEGRLIQAGLLPNPSFVLDTESAITERDPVSMSGRLVFTIPLARKRAWARGMQCESIAQARALVGQEAELLLAEAADAALEVLYYQQLGELQESANELAQRGIAAERERLDAKFTDQLTAETDSLASELDRFDTSARLEEARRRLMLAMSMPPTATVHLKGELAFWPVKGWTLQSVLALAQANQPRLAAASAQLAVSRQELGLARAEAWPDINLGPRYQGDLDGSNQRIGARFSMDVPIFDRNQGGIAEMAANVRASRSLVELARVATLNEVAAAYNGLTTLQQALTYYDEKMAPAIKRVEDTLAQAERQRDVAAYQAIALRQRMLRMQFDRLELLFRYHRLLTRLELYIGQPLIEPAAVDQPMVEPFVEPLAVGQPAEVGLPQ